MEELKVKVREVQRQLEAEKTRREQVRGEGSTCCLLGKNGGRTSAETRNVFKAQVKKTILRWGPVFISSENCPTPSPPHQNSHGKCHVALRTV